MITYLQSVMTGVDGGGCGRSGVGDGSSVDDGGGAVPAQVAGRL